MAKRSYEQYCAVAKALDLIGERWTILILRDLVHLGPRRYGDLLAGLPGIGSNLLAARLRALEDAGLVARRRLPPPAGSSVYELTELGRGLEPTLIELGRWGGNFMAERRECDLFLPTGHISAMRATFEPEAATGVRKTYELRIDNDVLYAQIDDGRLEAGQGEATHPDLVVHTDVETSIELMQRALPPAEALASGRVRIDGSEDDFAQCIDLLAWVPAGAAVSS